MKKNLLIGIAVIGAAVAVLGGCGGSDNTAKVESTTESIDTTGTGTAASNTQNAASATTSDTVNLETHEKEEYDWNKSYARAYFYRRLNQEQWVSMSFQERDEYVLETIKQIKNRFSDKIKEVESEGLRYDFGGGDYIKGGSLFDVHFYENKPQFYMDMYPYDENDVKRQYYYFTEEELNDLGYDESSTSTESTIAASTSKSAYEFDVSSYETFTVDKYNNTIKYKARTDSWGLTSVSAVFESNDWDKLSEDEKIDTIVEFVKGIREKIADPDEFLITGYYKQNSLALFQLGGSEKEMMYLYPEAGNTINNKKIYFSQEQLSEMGL